MDASQNFAIFDTALWLPMVADTESAMPYAKLATLALSKTDVVGAFLDVGLINRAHDS